MAVTTVAMAQERELQFVGSPFQGEFDYQIGAELDPAVEIDGVRWHGFEVVPRDDRPIDSEGDNPVVIGLDFENTNADKVKIHVIVLFEDDDGSPLVREECDVVSIGPQRRTEKQHKLKLSGTVMNSTRKVYLFCEVRR